MVKTNSSINFNLLSYFLCHCIQHPMSQISRSENEGAQTYPKFSVESERMDKNTEEEEGEDEPLSEDGTIIPLSQLGVAQNGQEEEEEDGEVMSVLGQAMMADDDEEEAGGGAAGTVPGSGGGSGGGGGGAAVGAGAAGGGPSAAVAAAIATGMSQSLRLPKHRIRLSGYTPFSYIKDSSIVRSRILTCLTSTHDNSTLVACLPDMQVTNNIGIVPNKSYGVFIPYREGAATLASRDILVSDEELDTVIRGGSTSGTGGTVSGAGKAGSGTPETTQIAAMILTICVFKETYGQAIIPFILHVHEPIIDTNNPTYQSLGYILGFTIADPQMQIVYHPQPPSIALAPISDELRRLATYYPPPPPPPPVAVTAIATTTTAAVPPPSHPSSQQAATAAAAPVVIDDDDDDDGGGGVGAPLAAAAAGGGGMGMAADGDLTMYNNQINEQSVHQLEFTARAGTSKTTDGWQYVMLSQDLIHFWQFVLRLTGNSEFLLEAKQRLSGNNNTLAVPYGMHALTPVCCQKHLATLTTSRGSTDQQIVSGLALNVALHQAAEVMHRRGHGSTEKLFRIMIKDFIISRFIDGRMVTPWCEVYALGATNAHLCDYLYMRLPNQFSISAKLCREIYERLKSKAVNQTKYSIERSLIQLRTLIHNPTFEFNDADIVYLATGEMSPQVQQSVKQYRGQLKLAPIDQNQIYTITSDYEFNFATGAFDTAMKQCIGRLKPSIIPNDLPTRIRAIRTLLQPGTVVCENVPPQVYSYIHYLSQNKNCQFIMDCLQSQQLSFQHCCDLFVGINDLSDRGYIEAPKEYEILHGTLILRSMMYSAAANYTSRIPKEMVDWYLDSHPAFAYMCRRMAAAHILASGPKANAKTILQQLTQQIVTCGGLYALTKMAEGFTDAAKLSTRIHGLFLSSEARDQVKRKLSSDGQDIALQTELRSWFNNVADNTTTTRNRDPTAKADYPSTVTEAHCRLFFTSNSELDTAVTSRFIRLFTGSQPFQTKLHYEPPLRIEALQFIFCLSNIIIMCFNTDINNQAVLPSPISCISESDIEVLWTLTSKLYGVKADITRYRDHFKAIALAHAVERTVCLVLHKISQDQQQRDFILQAWKDNSFRRQLMMSLLIHETVRNCRIELIDYAVAASACRDLWFYWLNRHLSSFALLGLTLRSDSTTDGGAASTPAAFTVDKRQQIVASQICLYRPFEPVINHHITFDSFIEGPVHDYDQLAWGCHDLSASSIDGANLKDRYGLPLVVDSTTTSDTATTTVAAAANGTITDIGRNQLKVFRSSDDSGGGSGSGGTNHANDMPLPAQKFTIDRLAISTVLPALYRCVLAAITYQPIAVSKKMIDSWPDLIKMPYAIVASNSSKDDCRIIIRLRGLVYLENCLKTLPLVQILISLKGLKQWCYDSSVEELKKTMLATYKVHGNLWEPAGNPEITVHYWARLDELIAWIKPVVLPSGTVEVPPSSSSTKSSSSTYTTTTSVQQSIKRAIAFLDWQPLTLRLHPLTETDHSKINDIHFEVRKFLFGCLFRHRRRDICIIPAEGKAIAVGCIQPWFLPLDLFEDLKKIYNSTYEAVIDVDYIHAYVLAFQRLWDRLSPNLYSRSGVIQTIKVLQKLLLDFYTPGTQTFKFVTHEWNRDRGPSSFKKATAVATNAKDKTNNDPLIAETFDDLRWKQILDGLELTYHDKEEVEGGIWIPSNLQCRNQQQQQLSAEEAEAKAEHGIKILGTSINDEGVSVSLDFMQHQLLWRCYSPWARTIMENKVEIIMASSSCLITDFFSSLFPPFQSSSCLMYLWVKPSTNPDEVLDSGLRMTRQQKIDAFEQAMKPQDPLANIFITSAEDRITVSTAFDNLSHINDINPALRRIPPVLPPSILPPLLPAINNHNTNGAGGGATASNNGGGGVVIHSQQPLISSPTPEPEEVIVTIPPQAAAIVTEFENDDEIEQLYTGAHTTTTT